MSASVQQITQATFDHDVLQAGTPVIVDFWAPWCGPCRMLAPEIEKTAELLGTRVTVAKVNVDENPLIASQYGVMSIPTIIVLYQGKEIGRQAGYVGADVLVPTMEDYLKAIAT